MTSVVQPQPPTERSSMTARPSSAPMERSVSIATVDMHIPGAWVSTNPNSPEPTSEDWQYMGEKVKAVPSIVQEYLPSSQTAATLKEKAAAAVPASVITTASDVFPSLLQPATGPTSADAEQPPVKDEASAVPETTEKETSESVWTEKVLSAGAVTAAGSYLQKNINPFAKSSENEPVSTPTGAHEDLTSPPPPVPSNSDRTMLKSTDSGYPRSKSLVRSTVPPDEETREAPENPANPEEFKGDIVSSNNSFADEKPPSAAGPGDDLGSKTAMGDTVPLSSTDAFEKNEEVDATVGEIELDSELKDQKGFVSRKSGSRLIEANDSFQHAVAPATPFTDDRDQEKRDKGRAGGKLSKLDTQKHKKEGSGSISVGEVSPSSPSRGVSGGTRKLTKKKNRCTSQGHSRNASTDDAEHEHTTALVPQESPDTQYSNSSEPGLVPSSPAKKERNVLRKESPTALNSQADNANREDETPSASTEQRGSAPTPSSPTKAGFREKLKGEFMVVSGTLIRDSSLKEAGKKIKEGAL